MVFAHTNRFRADVRNISVIPAGAGDLSPAVPRPKKVVLRFARDSLLEGDGFGTPSAKTPTMATKAADAARPRGRRRTTTAKPAGDKRSLPTLGDQVLALANGKTQQEIAAACKGARPNHVGVVIARHKRAGRIEERDGKLYATQSTETAQRAAV
jgi:hypothetical protein